MNIRNLNIWNRSDHIPEIYGVLIALGLIVYFFAMYAVGLVHVTELRILNLFIMLAGIYYAMKQYKRMHSGHLHYFRGLSVGVATTTIASSIFSVFLLLYLKIDQNLMASIIAREPMGRFLNEYIAAAAVGLEGALSGFTMTYLLLNYVETDKATEAT